MRHVTRRQVHHGLLRSLPLLLHLRQRHLLPDHRQRGGPPEAPRPPVVLVVSRRQNWHDIDCGLRSPADGHDHKDEEEDGEENADHDVDALEGESEAAVVLVEADVVVAGVVGALVHVEVVPADGGLGIVGVSTSKTRMDKSLLKTCWDNSPRSHMKQKTDYIYT